MQNTTPVFADIDFATHQVPDLHELLAKLRSLGPVVPVVYHRVTTWLIGGHRELVAAFADEETFPSAAMYRIHSEPVMGRTLQCMSGEEHRINRALVSSAFRPQVMRRSVETLLEPLAHEIIDEFAEEPQVDLIGAFTRRYPFRVITRLLGIPVSDEAQLLRWALGLIDYPWDPEGALACSAEFTRYLAPLVHERRRRPGEDLISELAVAEIEGERLSDEQIFSFVRLLFPAGSDTTYKALGSLLYAVLTEPGIKDALLADPGQRAAVVQEALRWEPPVALLPRMTGKDTRWGGVELAAGTPLLFGIAAANRDPEVFPEPDRFDPSRRSRSSLTFGHGVHFCLGSHLARRELEVALGAILERFPGLRLVEPDAVRITGGVLRGPAELRVALA
jgi:cytochrome P450